MAEHCAHYVNIELRTWTAYVARGQAPQADRMFGKSPAWRPTTVKFWAASRKQAPVPIEATTPQPLAMASLAELLARAEVDRDAGEEITLRLRRLKRVRYPDDQTTIRELIEGQRDRDE